MAHFNFYLDMRDDRKGERGIALWVRGCPKGEQRPIILRLNDSIPSSAWDKKKQRVKSNYTGSPELNRKIQLYEDTAKACVRELEIEGRNDFDTVKAALRAVFAPKKRNDFLAIYDEYLHLQKNVWQKNTYQKFQTQRNYLASFQQEKKFDLNFNAINKRFQDAFRLFLIDKGLLNNTISKQFSMLKTFMKWASERGYHKNIAYRDFKATNDKTEVIYLERDELMSLFHYDFTDNPTLDKVRDVFCFQCFTGQRFSDIANFKYDDVRDNVWHVRTKKTKSILRIPLTSFALSILGKYREAGALPVISSQKTNVYIKEACKVAGIDTPITTKRYRGNQCIERTEPKYNLIATHSARRTFVSLSLMQGMTAEQVMKITGHKTYAMLAKYLEIADAAVQEAMQKAWQ